MIEDTKHETYDRRGHHDIWWLEIKKGRQGTGSKIVQQTTLPSVCVCLVFMSPPVSDSEI